MHAATNVAGDDRNATIASIAAAMAAGDGRAFVINMPQTKLSEDGEMTTYTVALPARPASASVVRVRMLRGSASAAQVHPALLLVFTTDNWQTPQTVTVTGQRDKNALDDIATIIHSGEIGDYQGVITEATITVLDIDEPAVTISTSKVSLPQAATATYTVVLDTEPSDAVTVTPSSTDMAVAAVDGALTFTTTNWDTPQVVTVENDSNNDGANKSATITHEATGGDYLNAAVSSVLITVTPATTPE